MSEKDKAPPLTMAVIEKATDQIESILKEFSLEQVKGLSAMKQAIKLATGMNAMRNALSIEIVDRLFMPLQGSPLGFRTDRDKEKEPGYPIHIVKECIIEALMRGFYPVGNEFNIIAERAYFTKEGFDRKVKEVEGLTDLEFFEGVPQMVADKGALVPYRASWKINGRPDGIVKDIIKRADGSTTDERIAVRVNSGQGADAILGKARRKILAKIYERCTGVKYDDGDVGDAITTTGEVVPEQSKATSKLDELTEKHAGKVAKNGEKTTAQASLPADPAAGSDGRPEPGADG